MTMHQWVVFFIALVCLGFLADFIGAMLDP